MRCLITGVAGFIGSHLAERLLADGHKVCGIDAFTDYYSRALKEQNLAGPRSWERFTFVEGDLLEISLPPLLEGVDWIFHQAAQAGVRASWGQHFAPYAQNNLIATQRLLEAILHDGKEVKRVIYASSSSVYGNAEEVPVSELVTPQPISPYGVTKLAGEHLCTLYHQNFGVPTVSLRYFSVYGPRQRPDMAFQRWCRAILTGEPLVIYGDGQQTRDFTYVADIVEANMHSALNDDAVGKVLNIAGGSCVTVRQVIALLEEISGLPAHTAFTEAQHGDVRDTFADITCAGKILGYQPKIALPEGLARQFASLKESV